MTLIYAAVLNNPKHAVRLDRNESMRAEACYFLLGRDVTNTEEPAVEVFRVFGARGGGNPHPKHSMTTFRSLDERTRIWV